MSAEQLIDLCEFAVGTAGQALAVDREKGVIKGVKVLGEAGNAVYPRTTREKAAALIEGARVNIDHAPRTQAGETRSYRDGFGTIKNIHETGDGLRGDYHFPPKHALAEQLFWDAENAPHNLGFSIASRGRSSKVDSDGRQIVEEILFDRHSHSIDLVSSPATTRGLFESRKPTMKKKIKAVLEAHYASQPKKLVILREMAEAGLMSPDAEMEAPAEPSGASDAEGALSAGFRAAINKVLDDASMDIKAKVKKIKDILTMEEKLLAKEDAADAGADDATEGRRRVASDDKLALLEAKDLVRTAADDAGVRVPSAVLATVRAGITADQAKALVESLKPTGGQQQGGGNPPRSSPPWQPPSKGSNGAATPSKAISEGLVPAKAEDWAKALLE